MTDTPEEVRNLVESALATYNISINGQLTTIEATDDIYEVEAPFEGEVILEEVISNQGLLLYNKSGEGELSLKGLRDGKLLLTAKTDSD